MSSKKLSILWHSPYDKGVIAGLILGEGTITINSQGRKGWVTPRITICNTEIEIINLATRILYKAGIRYQFRSKFSPSQKGLKSLFKIDIKGIKSVLPILESMRSSFVGRKDKLCGLVIEFSGSRSEHMLKPYNDREKEIVREIKKLNPRGTNITLMEGSQ